MNDIIKPTSKELLINPTFTSSTEGWTVTPPFGSKRAAALALYQPPFIFKHGYIYDANHQVVSDDTNVDNHIAQRVRGWGRIGYMPDAEALQDEVGKVIAEALTAFWTNKENKQ